MTMNQRTVSQFQLADPSADPARPARLAIFTCFCLVLGVVAVYWLVSPRINPSILTETMLTREFSAFDKGSISNWGLWGPDRVLAILDHPESPMDFHNLAITLPSDVEFKAQDGAPLHGWFFDTPEAKGTALLCWGNIADIRFPVALGYVRVLQKAHLSVMLFDYRGCGKSAGRSTIDKVLADGEGAYNYLVDTRKIDPKTLVILGRDLGSYVAWQLSDKHPCRALILEEPFVNAKQFLIESRDSFATRLVPASDFPGDCLDTTKFLKERHVPALIVKTSIIGHQPEKVYSQSSQPKDYLNLTTRYGDDEHPDFIKPITMKFWQDQSGIYATKILDIAKLN